ncbi:pilus assembly protein [Nocardioides sp. WL0053]|uniref:Pilus assembly protein n=1 Tax=Nocardioides jiangsuensis TaxID=2866161 RepID=A0ABS7RFG5_9ACTN|nr:TadE family protein [Nocardioides jiangsuensis]MBY9073769.1 pilus assembly protein [Nocardioides jiangsuensis]
MAVEFALVLPLLVMMMLGTITGGLAYTRSIGLTNAVREGARFGATGDIAAATWATDVIDRVRETQFDDGITAGASTTTVCVQVIGATPVAPFCSDAGVNPPPPPAFPVADADLPALGAGECLVKVWASRHFEITLGVATPKQGDMIRHSVARYERDC